MITKTAFACRTCAALAGPGLETISLLMTFLAMRWIKMGTVKLFSCGNRDPGPLSGTGLRPMGPGTSYKNLFCYKQKQVEEWSIFQS
jgi:hypothetical protein